MKKSVSIFIIAKKEFLGFINSPLSFVITVPFLLISTFIYLRTSLVVGEASLRPYFEFLPWLLILLAPALSMKLLTDEKQRGTLELLFAHPISETEIILGKFLGALTFFLFIMATTLLLPLSLLVVANPDLGIIFSQYLGAIFVAATFLSLGLLASSYVANAIGSFLVAASLSFVLILIGLDFVTMMFPWPFSKIAEELAILTHMSNIARGLLDIRDILYFLTASALFLTATIAKLSQRRLEEDASEKRKLNLALFIIIGIGITLNFLMSSYPLRLDLTEQHLFTLSPGSRQTLKSLPDIVTINIFASHNLPGTMQLTLKETEDLLKDYQRFGKKVVIKTLYPETDAAAAQEAKEVGIREVTFNKIGSGKFEVQSGFLGLTIRYGEKTETISFIEDTSDLEYQLTKRVRKLVSNKEMAVGIFKNASGSYTLLDEVVKTQYKVANIDISALMDKNKRQEIGSLIVIDDGTQDSTASSLLKTYLEEDGKLLVLANGVTINPQLLTANKTASTLTGFLSDYGIKIKNDLVFDPTLSEILTFGQGQVRYAAPYPFWLRALPNANDFSPLSGLKSITLGWPSSLEINQKEGVSVKKILETSKNAGKQEGNFNISPTESDKLSGSAGEAIPLAVSLEKGNMKLVVVGDSDFVDDQFLQGFSENVAFLANTIDYLTADKDLAAIPKKTATRPVFKFRSPLEILVFQYGNILIPPILVIIFAVFWLTRRKRLTNRTYEK